MVLTKKVLVAVYGSLRRGFGNYRGRLATEKFVGQFETDPQYTMFDLGAFPGVVEGGASPIVMEVFEIDATKLASLDSLEGYRGKDNEEKNFYNRKEIDTPFGKAYTYIYNHKGTRDLDIVESGDWTDHVKSKNLIKT